MDDDVRRIFAFAASGDMGGQRTVSSRYGTAVYSDRVPKRLDSNHLRVEEPVADTDDLVEELRRLDRRMAFFPNGSAGDRVATAFVRRGWRVDRHVVMAQRRAPERPAATALVREVDERSLRPARQRLLEHEPWAEPEVVEQLLLAKELLADSRHGAALCRAARQRGGELRGSLSPRL